MIEIINSEFAEAKYGHISPIIRHEVNYLHFLSSLY